jgi:hypothetical protein
VDRLRRGETHTARRARLARDGAAMEVVAIRWFDEDLASYVALAQPDLLREVMARGTGSSRRLPDRRLHYRPGGSHPEASRRVGLDA